MSDRGFDGPSGTIRGRARLKFLATILALVGAGVLVPAAPGQSPFEMEMDVGGAGFSVSATMPDPVKTAQKFLQCDDAPAGCMDEVFEAATPRLKAKPVPAPQPEQPSPPPSPRSPPPSEPASAPAQQDSEASSNTPGSRPRTVGRRSSASGGVGSAGTAEQSQLTPLVEERTGPPLPGPSSPPRATEPEPLRGIDPLGSPAPALTLSPPLESGLDWTPLLLGILLAAGSLALVFLVLVAAPQHSLARVSHPLADRRYELGLIGGVMLLGVGVGYLVATGLG